MLHGLIFRFFRRRSLDQVPRFTGAGDQLAEVEAPSGRVLPKILADKQPFQSDRQESFGRCDLFDWAVPRRH